MKTVLHSLLLLMVVAVAPVSAQTLGIAAIVNDDVISIYDLDSRISLLIATSNHEDTQANRKRLSKQVLNRLIDEKLKMQEARRLNINIPRNAINKAFADMEQRNKLPKGGLSKLLAAKGVDRLALMEQIEADIAWGNAVNRTLRFEIQIGDEEIDEIIEDIRAGKGKPEYLLAEIFLPVNNPQADNDVHNLARRLNEHLKSGANFPSIARNYSQSASAAVGGDLGWVRLGQLGNEIDVVMTSLGKGQASAPIRTIAGYYIILVRNIRTGKGLASPDLKVKLQQVFFPMPISITDQEIAARMATIKASTETIEGCDNLDALGREQGSPLSGSLGEVRVDQLPEAIADAIAPLDIGRVSNPLRSGEGIIVLMVCEKTGTPALQAARDKIKANLINQRLNIAAGRRLRDLRNTAFVDIRI